MTRNHTLIDAGLAAFRLTGLDRALRPATRGVGAILAFHRVRPWRPAAEGYAPNRALEITPEFLDQALRLTGRLGYEFVSLSEVRRRLLNGTDRPFAALTFDDGYRDVLAYAVPILKRYGAPFTLFLAVGFLDRSARLWWLELEEAVRRVDAIDIDCGGLRIACDTRTVEAKSAAFERIYWALRARPEGELLTAIERFAEEARVDRQALYADLFIDWNEARALAQNPLVEVGAHGVTHRRLAHWPLAEARAEMTRSKTLLEESLRTPVHHFAFPVGDSTSAGPREFALAKEVGFVTAVTTRPGVVSAAHADHLWALPRVSVNGLWQRERALETLLSGAPFALANRGRRLDVS